MAVGAAHDHRGDDEQYCDLKDHERGSFGGR
jgi:hypothetical protein